jgi:hypothetical protein
MDTSPMSRTDLFIAILLSMLFIVDDFCQLGDAGIWVVGVETLVFG